MAAAESRRPSVPDDSIGRALSPLRATFALRSFCGAHEGCKGPRWVEPQGVGGPSSARACCDSRTRRPRAAAPRARQAEEHARMTRSYARVTEIIRALDHLSEPAVLPSSHGQARDLVGPCG